MTSSICIITLIVVRSRESEIHATFKAKTSRSFEDAAAALLSTLCDAVVHVSDNEDFQIVRPSDRLAAILLITSAESLKGTSFLANVEPEDHDRLREFLGRKNVSAGSLHITMRDVAGSSVEMQVFHTRGLDIDGNVFHVVGLKDDSEHPEQPSDFFPEDIEIPVRNQCPSIAEDSCSTASLSTIDIANDNEQLAAWINPWKPGYTIEKFSMSFTVLTGPCAPGTMFLNWVANKNEFTEWVQYFVNDVSAHSYDQVVQTEAPPLAVALKPPHQSFLGFELRARVYMVADVTRLDDEGDWEESSLRLKLTFTDIHKVRRRVEAGAVARNRNAETMLARCRGNQRNDDLAGGEQNPEEIPMRRVISL